MICEWRDRVTSKATESASFVNLSLNIEWGVFNWDLKKISFIHEIQKYSTRILKDASQP